MEKPAGQCAYLKTEMLNIVFELIYFTFFRASRYRKAWTEGCFGPLQVLARDFAAVLFRAPEADGTSLVQVRACIARIEEEVEKLYRGQSVSEEQYTEAQQQLGRLEELMQRIPASCMEHHGA